MLLAGLRLRLPAARAIPPHDRAICSSARRLSTLQRGTLSLALLTGHLYFADDRTFLNCGGKLGAAITDNPTKPKPDITTLLATPLQAANSGLRDSMDYKVGPGTLMF